MDRWRPILRPRALQKALIATGDPFATERPVGPPVSTWGEAMRAFLAAQQQVRIYVEAYLRALDCGIRKNGRLFEVFALEDERSVVVTFSDLQAFADVNRHVPEWREAALRDPADST